VLTELDPLLRDERMGIASTGQSFDRPAEANAGSCRAAATSTERRLRFEAGPDRTRLDQTGRDWTEYGARTTAPSPQHRADAGKPALRRAHRVGRALPGAGGEWKKALSHARRRARLRRAQGKSERAQARPLYPQSHCPPPEGETRGTGGKTTDQANVQTTDEESVEVSPVFLSPLCSRISRK